MRKLASLSIAGMSLIETVFAMGILATTCSFLAASYISAVKVNDRTQRTVIAYRAAHSTTEALNALSTEDIISAGYIGTVRYFDVKGIPGENPINMGRIQVYNVTNSNDTTYSAGAHLKVVVTVVTAKHFEIARVVSYKYDMGGTIPPGS